MLDAQGRSVDVLHDVVWRHRGKKIAPKTLNQKRYVDAIRRSTVTFGVGPAGTGKTYLAMALAVSALDDRAVARIILTRPAVEAGERLGFLPGDMLAKVDPYLRPLFDALYDMLDADRLAAYMEKGIIEVAPLAFMRGRTLNDSFIVLDEAQNTTPEQMQMFLTRLGFGSKIVVTGDPTQNDLARGERSGLADVSEVLPGIAGHRVRELRLRGRRAPQARAADRLGLQGAGRAARAVGAIDPRAARPRGRGRRTRTVSTPPPCERWRRAVLAAEGVEGPCALGIAFVGESEMRALNAEHRDLDEVTDVLAFPLDGVDELPPGLERQLGDVVVCFEQAARQAAEAGVETRAEVRTLVVHGLLHLLGHDHEADAGEMLARQDALIAVLPQL